MVILEVYDCGVNFFYFGGLEMLSFDGVDWFWMGLCVVFFNVMFMIYYMIGCEDLMMLLCLVICWSFYGMYEGWGVFGIFMGVEVYVLGISYVEFGVLVGGMLKLCCEWIFFDEIVIWK